MRPRRISIGCYSVSAAGQQIVLQRCGRSGFKVVMRPGAKSPIFRLLREAAKAAIEAADPWPFEVAKSSPEQPEYFRRTA